MSCDSRVAKMEHRLRVLREDNRRLRARIATAPDEAWRRAKERAPHTVDSAAYLEIAAQVIDGITRDLDVQMPAH